MSAQLAFVKQGETLGVSKAEISARREIGDSKSYAGLYIEVEFYENRRDINHSRYFPQ